MKKDRIYFDQFVGMWRVEVYIHDAPVLTEWYRSQTEAMIAFRAVRSAIHG